MMWFFKQLRIQQGYKLLGWLGLGLWLAIAPPLLSHLIPIRAIAVTLKTEQQAQSIPSLLAQGRTAYHAGQFANAVTYWHQAAQQYVDQGSIANQALSFSYLASAYKALGQWDEARGAIAHSLDLLDGSNASPILAQVWNTQGGLQLATGQAEAALESWQQAEALYADLDDFSGRLGSQLNQAQALQSLGFYHQARTTLETVQEQLQSQPDSPLKANALHSLGITLQRVGAFPASLEALQQGLAVTQAVDSSANTSPLFLSLGQTWQGLSDTDKAIESYQQAAEMAQTAIARVEAQLSWVNLLIAPEKTPEKTPEAEALLSSISAELGDLPASRAGVYAQVHFVQRLLELSPLSGSTPSNSPLVRGRTGASPLVKGGLRGVSQILAKAIQQARQLNDIRAESYALGQLGHVYEQAEQWSQAQTITEQALELVDNANAADMIYQWQWQLGRILCQGTLRCMPNTHWADRNKAIAAYTEAVDQLKLLRTDLVANSQVQFSFRERVEPVYRQLAALLLTPAPDQTQVSQANLSQARDVIEALQLAELDNYFQSACLDVAAQNLDELDPAAAILYPILLPDRLAVILALQDQPLHYYETVLDQAEIQRSLSEMRQSLNPVYPNDVRLQVSQQLYDWLIRPATPFLDQANIQTLVLVPDGLLRSLPIAALHDGEHYLIENYGVAINSGLKLVEAQFLEPDRLNLLLGGLTEAREGFSDLPAAVFEIEQIAAHVPSQVLLNQNFTQVNLQTELAQSDSPIVHLSTHGQFSSNQDETFILAWDKKINATEFSRLLQNRELRDADPIELLVLSACQTASGDEQAGLGLAGLALRSGARSTVASLWSVNDQATANLMVEFYRSLAQPETTKADALRQAQLHILHQKDNKNHPFFWAAFIVIGSWS